MIDESTNVFGINLKRMMLNIWAAVLTILYVNL